MLSNVCIKDNTITHAAKGLIALMMSLPDTWNFTISGLDQVLQYLPPFCI